MSKANAVHRHIRESETETLNQSYSARKEESGPRYFASVGLRAKHSNPNNLKGRNLFPYGKTGAIGLNK